MKEEEKGEARLTGNVMDEMGEIVSISREQKETLLNAAGRQLAAGLKYIMCMVTEELEKARQEAQRAGLKYIMCMVAQEELGQRAGLKYIMCKVAEQQF